MPSAENAGSKGRAERLRRLLARRAALACGRNIEVGGDLGVRARIHCGNGGLALELLTKACELVQRIGCRLRPRVEEEQVQLTEAANSCSSTAPAAYVTTDGRTAARAKAACERV